MPTLFSDLFILSPHFLMITFIACLLGGMLRGFSGFGFFLIALPVFGLFYDPAILIPCVFAFGLVCSLQLLPRIKSNIQWNQLKFIWIGYLIAFPIGLYLLKVIPVDILRLSIGVFILLSLIAIVWGHLLSFTAKPLYSVLSGLISVLTGGSTGIDGPPIVLYLNASHKNHKDNRATLIACFIITTALACLLAFMADLFERQHVDILGVGLLAILIGNYIGAHGFSKATKEQYQFVVYGMILIMALLLIYRSF